MSKFKFINKTVLITTGVIYGLVFIFILIIDPAGNFNLFSSSFNKEKFITNKYNVVDYMETLNSHESVLLFGSSRSFKFNEEVLGEKIVIKPHVVYNNPHCVYDFIKQLNKTQISNIKKIYYNLSYHVFNGYKQCNITDYSKLFFPKELISFKGIADSLESIHLNLNKDKQNYTMNTYGTKKEVKPRVFIPEKVTKNKYYYQNLEKEKNYQIVTPDTLESLSKIYKFALDNKIEIIFFTDPLTDYRLASLDFNLLKKQHLDWLNVIPSYYALNYIENFSNDYRYFSDDNHINNQGAIFIFENFLSQKNSKYLVDRKKISNYLDEFKRNYTLSKELFIQKYLIN